MRYTLSCIRYTCNVCVTPCNVYMSIVDNVMHNCNVCVTPCNVYVTIVHNSNFCVRVGTASKSIHFENHLGGTRFSLAAKGRAVNPVAHSASVQHSTEIPLHRPHCDYQLILFQLIKTREVILFV